MTATGRRLKEPDLKNAEAAFVSKDEEPWKGWLVLQADATPGLLAHEASHAIRHLSAFIGTEFDEESFAHHQGYLVDRIHRFMKRGR
jgi:hypothetical protein